MKALSFLIIHPSSLFPELWLNDLLGVDITANAFLGLISIELKVPGDRFCILFKRSIPINP